MHYSPDEAKLMYRATFAAVSVALTLVIVKWYAWYVTGSVGVLSSLADSALDGLVSVMNLLAVRYALQPPDEDHRFGHAGAEDLAAMFQSVFIMFSAAFVAYHAIDRFVHPRPLVQEALGMGVMGFSIVATLGLVLFQKSVVRKTGSKAISADSFHYTSDVLVNISIIVGIMLVTYTDFWWADPLIGLLVALYIFYGALEIGKGAVDRLMDKEFEEEERQKVEDIIRSSKGVLGMHDLKTRSSGAKEFIQCHVEMDGDISLFKAHQLADAIEAALSEAFPRAEILLHQDPHIPGKKL